MKIHLLIIDPQIDFCWPGIDTSKYDVAALENMGMESLVKPGALYVPGAHEDMQRLSTMVRELKHKIDDIHITLDSHHYVDIAHPSFWLDSNGQHPAPFTIITPDDVDNGIYKASFLPMHKRAAEYVHALQANNRYPLCIWPPHCLIGRTGSAIHPDLEKAVLEWEKEFAVTNYVTKGSNIYSEHYSAVQADVPDPTDPSTQINTGLIDTLKDADIIALAGEAKSHCLANTVVDIANNFGEENIKKLVLLDDATSNVPDPPGTTMFTDASEKFVKDMTARGMKVSTTVDFLR
jgi:nicotinamidase-related amidase